MEADLFNTKNKVRAYQPELSHASKVCKVPAATCRRGL